MHGSKKLKLQWNFRETAKESVLEAKEVNGL